ncbi:V-type ATP synthase subunit I [Treponema sp.]
MIVPMKKLSLVVIEKERETALDNLRQLGVVHLEKKSVASEKLSSLIDKKTKAEQAAGILRNFPSEGPSKAKSSASLSGESLIKQTLAAAEDRKTEQEVLASRIKEKSRIEAWGTFEPQELESLKAEGLTLIPYELPRKNYENLTKDQRVLVLSSSKTLVRCLAVGEALKGESPFYLPEQSLSSLEKAIVLSQETLLSLEAKLRSLALSSDLISSELIRLNAEIEFEAARAGMETTADSPDEMAVSWISGFIPEDAAGLIKRAAMEQGWALLIDDPSDSDAPPTKIRNNALVRLVQPVFDLLGTVPGYREYDISLSFLAFFALFFAMIFGDAGYGSLLLAIALFFGLKAKFSSGRVPDGLLLIGLLSSATIVWGAITGTWFALPFDGLHPFLKALVIPPFYPNPSLDAKEAAKLVQQNVKHFCFIIGTFQLVLAHTKNIKKALPSLTALAQLGWLSMVLGLYFLVLNLVLDKTAFPVPAFSTWMIGGGLAAYFIFAEQKGGNFFKNILTSVGNFLPTFLSAVSSFSDIISYIRLFAVGLAGFAIAQSFNGMAAGLPSGMIRIVAGGLILFFGHGLNLAMSALSVVVHGVRLNMLEYSGHLGMEWSGVKYAPFALKDEKSL